MSRTVQVTCYVQLLTEATKFSGVFSYKVTQGSTALPACLGKVKLEMGQVKHRSHLWPKWVGKFPGQSLPFCNQMSKSNALARVGIFDSQADIILFSPARLTLQGNVRLGMLE